MSGGTERVAYMIAEYLRQSGHNVLNLGCIKTSGWVESGTVMLPDATEYPTARNIKFLKELIQERSIDVIINESGNSEAIYLFSHQNVPDEVRIITHLHFDIIGELNTFYASLNLPLRNVSLKQFGINAAKWLKAPINRLKAKEGKLKRYNYMVENTDCVVTLSDVHKEDFISFTKCEYPPKVVGVINPLTYECQRVDWLKKENLILFVGRLDYAKRVDRALKIWQKLSDKYPDWKFVIVGDGPDRKRLENIVSREKLQRVEFTGFISPKEYYKRAKVLLLASNHEGTPMVIGEAMANGVVPVVMNSFAGARVMIEKGVDGLLTPYASVPKMAKALASLMMSSTKLQEMADAGMKRIEMSDNDKLLSKWKSLIKK